MIQMVAAPHQGIELYPAAGRSKRKPRVGVYGLVAFALMAASGAVVGGVQERMSRDAEVSSPSVDTLRTGPFSYFPR